MKGPKQKLGEPRMKKPDIVSIIEKGAAEFRDELDKTKLSQEIIDAKVECYKYSFAEGVRRLAVYDMIDALVEAREWVAGENIYINGKELQDKIEQALEKACCNEL